MTASVDDRLVRERLRARAGATDLRTALRDIIASDYPLLDARSASRELDRLMAVVAGLGPLDALLRDPDVTDVLVNGSDGVWIEARGRLHRTDVVIDPDELALVVERAFRRNGLSVDRSHPIGDTRLESGARISVVLPPLAVDGLHLAIRRFPEQRPELDAFGPPEVVDALRDAIERRVNIVVFGATGSGKTSLVNALADAIDPQERVVTIEDAAELRLGLPHVVRLECRPDNGDGVGGVELRSLVRAALRLRPDRMVVGEVRGAEALDMIWALATGHDGSLSTCHAKSAAELLARLETFVLLADAALPLLAVRSQVRAAVDMVVGVERDGARRVVRSIHEVVPDPDHPTGVVTLLDGRRWSTAPPAAS